MKRYIAIAAVLAAIVICSEGSSQAQSLLNPGGFPYPSYIQQGFQGGPGAFGGFGFQQPREQPPYFAKFPPVYYSHAVKRPYGVSPYAVPAGITPVEYSVPTQVRVSKPVVINNPYFNGGGPADIKVKAEKKVKVDAKPTKDKVVGWQANPFYKPQLALN